jgi:type IV secretory pathway VirB10-like protein
MRPMPLHSLAILALLGAGDALGAEDIGAAVHACRAEADDARRLACYDDAVGRATRAAPSAAPAPPTPAPATAAAAATEPPVAAPTAAVKSEDDFGRERQMAYEEDQKRAEASRAVGELQSTIIGLEKRIDGLMTFTLDNGQVWRQSRPDSKFSIKEGDAIRIQPGSLGSYILSGPTKKSTRVTRVK